MTTFLKTKVKLLSHGAALPPNRYTTDQMLETLQSLSGWRYAKLAQRISKHLGVESRHLSRDVRLKTSAPTPSNSDLAVEVVQACLDQAHLQSSDLDYLLAHTCTPDTQVPPSVAWVADKINYKGLYLELRQACTGFASALQMAVPRIESLGKPVMLVGSETGSVYFDHAPQFLDQAQLVNYLQMGDGAAGVLLGSDDGSGQGIISDIYMGQIGVGKSPGLYLDGGSTSVYTQEGPARFHHDAAKVKQNGEMLFKAAIDALNEQGHQLDSFDYIIPHQASGHIDVHFSKATGIAQEKIINDAKHLGNLGSSAIWMSFSRLLSSGKLEHGDRVLVIGAEATKYLYGGFIYTH
ncbi:3-oxoacyl-[acyl-carrier-protein] synthase III C-terminal domain-containing protein [Vibrio sp. SCSIO 43136]|uniref:3-oxoacyl-ACP synthase III family protein n=1 Tax=Vibrio sp. SCSIO 43136 TaxID=2819101 RepID=UPI002075F789|nr:3-oxoacyl-[acyl-carrier-protein] synthase III C-terminal domain-containing protein [Vibrio sp. SCSIO 43136]USD67908.1 hypothetical protein J4N39_17130 [Vibrio sp. SCSIO 43136]